MFVSPLNYAGEGRRRIPISIATLVLAAVLDLILIHQIGILGAAVGTNIGFALFAAGNLWLAHEIFGLPLRPVALSAARSLTAAAGMAAILALMGTGELSPVEWVVGAFAGGGTFVALLLATRQLSLSELRDLARLPAKALRRE
jgi:O-antigen/teichoic acid export membrane protein